MAQNYGINYQETGDGNRDQEEEPGSYGVFKV